MDDYGDFDEYGQYEDDLENWECDRVAEDLALERGDYGDPDDWDEDYELDTTDD